MTDNPNIEDVHECEHINPNSVIRGTTFEEDPIATVKVFKWKEWDNWTLQIDGVGQDCDDCLELDIVYCPMCGTQLQKELIQQ